MDAKKTLALIETGTQRKIWIGIPYFLASISVGLQREDETIWTGTRIYDSNFIAFIRAWHIATLFSKTLPYTPSLFESKCLEGCIAAFEESNLPLYQEEVEYLRSIYPTVDEEIQEVSRSIPPTWYIEKSIEMYTEHRITFDVVEFEGYLEKSSISSDVISSNLTSYKQKMLEKV